MWIILAALLLLAFLSTAQFATPAQKADNRKRVHRAAFWLWLVMGPIVTWMAWDGGGPFLGLAALGLVAFLLTDCRRKGWGADA